MSEGRFAFSVSIPTPSPFEVGVLRRLKQAAPEPLPATEVIQPRNTYTLTWTNRLALLGLIAQYCAGDELFFTLTHIGEQALAALELTQP